MSETLKYVRQRSYPVREDQSTVDYEETEASDLEIMVKKIKVPCNGETVELPEDRNLFACTMVICKSRPESDIKEAVRTYKFSVVPQSMFAADGAMLHCPAKSALMHILEKVPSSTNECRIFRVSQETNECLSSMQWLRCNPLTSLNRYATACTSLITSFCASLESMKTVMRSDRSLIDMISQHP